MLKNQFFLLIAIILSACSNAQEGQSQEVNAKLPISSSQICSKTELASSSKNFLNALKEGDIATAQSFYYPQAMSKGDDHGVAYTFFPDNNHNAVFNFNQKNSESAFEIDVFGEYNDGRDKGQLVLFVQQKHKNRIRDESFLFEKKFSEYFACYFQCIDGEWKITKYTCFEDSGGPFQPPDSDYP